MKIQPIWRPIRLAGFRRLRRRRHSPTQRKQFFDGRDSAKLKDQKSLKAAGDFLAQNQFGFAVVVVSAGMEGDTQKDLVLTEARAMVIREYLVENFGFDDSQLKTMGMGKQTGAASDADWGSIQILIFPPELRYRQTRIRRQRARRLPISHARGGASMTGNKHNPEGHSGDHGEANPGPYWYGCIGTRRFWVCAFMMAAALAIYVLSGDLAWVPRPLRAKRQRIMHGPGGSCRLCRFQHLIFSDRYANPPA